MICFAWGFALAGCSMSPYRPAPVAMPVPPTMPATTPATTMGNEIAMRAIALLGSPYQWGAAGPTQFDCSGLVRYIHNDLGIGVPRTAAEQYAAARRVDMRQLAPGDLLFFKIRGGGVSHVAIYAGEGRFVHAPQTGRPVELRTLNDDYYRPRLVGVGRMF
jgi:cell wall-associated NlpC family hydrolase